MGAIVHTNRPILVSANGTDTSPLYSVNPVSQVNAKLPLTVSIPGSGATGQVFNSGSSFNGNRFLFVNEDGTVSGWLPALGISP